MFDIVTDLDFSNELLDELKLFTKNYSGEKVCVTANATEKFSCNVLIADACYDFEETSNFEKKSAFKRFVKTSLYRALTEFYGTKAPWGSLTGVRPTKLAYERLNLTGSYDGIAEYLQNDFFVSERKSKTVERILKAQQGIAHGFQNKVNLYVHIPFCDGRCAYCSFPSADINIHGGMLDTYVDALIDEIKSIKLLIQDQNKEILTVYVGGGTPSVLSTSQLERLFAAIGCHDLEFTFEAGRPDSITLEKLSVMEWGNVTRVCINPQSLNDKTLTTIGRKHTAQDFFRAYELASKKKFSLNTDIIAGLQGETFPEFVNTLDLIAKLSPDNITVHTLSRKRGSDFAERMLECDEIEKMMEFAYDRLTEYEPYYLYRQKYMIGNLENTGFCLPGKICVNNITVMEETVPVYACGAGSISKNIVDGIIMRHQSPKEVKMYLNEFDIRLHKKHKFLMCGIDLKY